MPTNRPRQRIDYPDAIYKTVNGKYNAVIQQVLECHQKGQPVLVGTVSVEKSETLAKMLQKYTRDFNVLNAKNHEREAEIVAQAGKKGAITIATNMAGRGTDIMLGGNAEFMAKAQMRKEHFCENLLNPEKPEDADPAAVEMLLTEANGHGDTEMPTSLLPASASMSCTPSASPRSMPKLSRCALQAACSSSAPNATRAAASTTSCAAVPAVRATRVLPAST